MIDKWDRRFLSLAAEVAKWSKDPSTQVGAILVSPDRRRIVPGYNGPPAGVDDLALLWSGRAVRVAATIHAEVNAVLQARDNVSGYTCYCTAQPCCSCLAVLVQSGISRIVCPAADEAFAERWGLHSPAYIELYKHVAWSFTATGEVK